MVNTDITEEHLDPTSEISLAGIKTRALKGVVVLTGRTFFLSFLSLIATGFLTVFLDPSQFGVFWIVSAVVNFMTYFSDIGLAAALIQKKEKIDEDDLKTTFAVQQTLVIALLIVLYFLSPLFVKIYSLSSEGLILLFALGLSFFMSSLKTIPSVLLERELSFEKLVLPQVLENLVYNLVAVILAWQGFGIRSFTYAVVLRGIVGLVAIYILRPWRPGLSFSKKTLKKLLVFGVPYQLNTLLATLKDDGMTAVLGGVLGASGLGFLGWAQKWGQAPLRFFMDHVIKVTFPAFSRLQEKKAELSNSLTKSIFFICFLVFPTLAGLLSLSPLLVSIIPKYEKWQPAIIPLFLIGVNTIFASVTTQLTNVLNAIGKIKVTFKLMIMWTALTWIFVPFLAFKYGVTGAALGYSIVGTSSIVAIIIVKRFINFSLKGSFLAPFISAALMFLVMFSGKRLLPENFASVVVLSILGIFVYLVLVYFLSRGEVLQYFRKGVGFLKKKNRKQKN